MTNPPFDANQTFFDPAPQAAGQPHPTATWRGGCGREPLIVDPYTGFPWGSWGYEKENKGSDGNTYLGYSHVYRSRDFVPKSVCVNFYDVHGGGDSDNGSFQVPNAPTASTCSPTTTTRSRPTTSTSTATPACHFARITTKARPAPTSGGKISDTADDTEASPTDRATDGDGHLQRLQGPATCTGARPSPAGRPPSTSTKAPKSPPNVHPDRSRHLLLDRLFHRTADPQAIDVSTTCKEAEETSVVDKVTPITITTQAPNGGRQRNQVTDTAHSGRRLRPDRRPSPSPLCADRPPTARTPLVTDVGRVNGNGDYYL